MLPFLMKNLREALTPMKKYIPIRKKSYISDETTLDSSSKDLAKKSSIPKKYITEAVISKNNPISW